MGRGVTARMKREWVREGRGVGKKEKGKRVCKRVQRIGQGWVTQRREKGVER